MSSATSYLVATDFSEGSSDAFQWAVANTAEDNELVFLFVVPEQDSEEGRVAAEEEARRKFAESVEPVLQARHRKYSFVVREGAAGKQIVRFANAAKVDTIIIGARGIGAVAKFMLGSVSDYVVKHAHCHVVVAKGMFAGEVHL